MSGNSDLKNRLQIIKDTLTLDYAVNLGNFVSAEQTILTEAIEKYSKIARTIYKNGYSQADEGLGEGTSFFTIYEGIEPDLLINLIGSSGNTVTTQKSVDILRKAANTLTYDAKMRRIVRDPLDPAKIVADYPIKTIQSSFWKNKQETKQGLTLQQDFKYGLTKIDLEFKNANPFAASRMVDVTCTFTLRNIADIDVPDENGAKLRDLLSFRGGKPVEQSEYTGYGIRLIVGYTPPSAKRLNLFSKEEQEAINHLVETNKLVLDLELIDYDISLQQDGQTSLTLSYVSYIEEALKSKAAVDIFAGTINSKAQISDQIGGKGTGLASSLLEAYNIAQRKKADVEDLKKAVAAYNEQVKLEAWRANNKVNQGRVVFDKTEFKPAAYDRLQERAKNLRNSFFKHMRDFQATEGAFANFAQLERTKYMDNGYENLYENTANYVSYGLGDVTGLGAHQHTDDITLFEVGGDLEEIDQELTDAESNYRAKIEELNALLLVQNKVKKYRMILDTLFKSDKIYHVPVEVDKLVLFSVEYKNNFNKILAELGEGDASLIQAQQAAENAKVASDTATKAKEGAKAIVLEENVAQAVETEAQRSAKENSAGQVVDIKQFLMPPQSASSPSSSEHDLYFVYLGDIIDAVYKTNYAHVGKALDLQRICLALGSVIDKRNGKNITYNIADIPISLSFFMEFFNKNIIDKDIDKYPFFKFLQDLGTQLITPAINLRSTVDSSRNKVQVKFTTFDMIGDKSSMFPAIREDTTGYETIYRNPSALNLTLDEKGLGGPKDVSRLNLKQSDKLHAAFVYRTNPTTIEEASLEKKWSVILMYATISDSFFANISTSGNLPFKNKLNMRNILSFTMGGLQNNSVKEFLFKKVKKKYQVEMMAARSMERGEEYREAWNIYDLDLKMIGHYFLKPGMHFYSKLVTSDSSADPLLSYYLGLEGFYLVTQVKHSLDLSSTAGIFETTITGKWQSSGATPLNASTPISSTGIIEGSGWD